QQVFTRWDGKGVPDGVGGEAITQAMRLFHLADTVEVYHHDDGTIEAAVEVARARRGTHFDPADVDVFCAAAGDVLVGIDARAEWEALIEAEPGLQRSLTELELDAALEGVAEFTDLRSPPRAGHSRGVADLAAKAGELCGLSPGDSTTLRRAALVHDIGMHGIPATILDKPGPLSESDWERMRMHAYYTQRMLSRPPPLARIGTVAAMATERLDGSGYHRGLSGAAIPTTGRILAAADADRAMTEPRPHRPPLSLKQASDELRSEVRAGRLAPDAVDAVLAAAGKGAASGPPALPVSRPARSKCSP
ncbi:MAG: HD-GYP domain-containing protein, partial [Acidimicrobiales bacterium]